MVDQLMEVKLLLLLQNWKLNIDRWCGKKIQESLNDDEGPTKCFCVVQGKIMHDSGSKKGPVE